MLLYIINVLQELPFCVGIFNMHNASTICMHVSLFYSPLPAIKFHIMVKLYFMGFLISKMNIIEKHSIMGTLKIL